MTVASVAPGLLIGFAVLSIGYAWFGLVYSRTARELRRLDSITKVRGLRGRSRAEAATVADLLAVQRRDQWCRCDQIVSLTAQS